MITRSFSQPVARTASTPDPQIEVLYNLPSVRIVAFTTPNSIYRPGSSHGSPAVEEDTPGTLPWVSRYERTIAIGKLRWFHNKDFHKLGLLWFLLDFATYMSPNIPQPVADSSKIEELREF